MEDCLLRGADVNALITIGVRTFPALTHAVGRLGASGSNEEVFDITRLLLAHKANPNLGSPASSEIDLSGVTALHLVESFSAAKLIIGVKANVNSEDSHGFTPLMRATQYGHVDILKLLLLCGAHTMNEAGRRAIDVDSSSDWKCVEGSVQCKALLQLFDENPHAISLPPLNPDEERKAAERQEERQRQRRKTVTRHLPWRSSFAKGRTGGLAEDGAQRVDGVNDEDEWLRD